MKIGWILRLRMAYAFWKALGAKNHNSMLAVVHESGFASISSGDLTEEAVKSLKTDISSARGYDHER